MNMCQGHNAHVHTHDQCAHVHSRAHSCMDATALCLMRLPKRDQCGIYLTLMQTSPPHSHFALLCGMWNGDLGMCCSKYFSAWEFHTRDLLLNHP